MFKSTSFKNIYWCITIIAALCCCFYICKNSTWLIGDDMITASVTGSGKFIIPGERDNFENGRFFPMAFTFHNILPLLYGRGTYISAFPHYCVHAVTFFIFVILYSLIFLNLTKRINEPLKRYGITFFLLIVAMSRAYMEFTNCHDGIYMCYFLVALFSYEFLRFKETHRVRHAIISVISLLYFSFCYEHLFSLPLSIGLSSLLFENNERKEKKLSWALTLTGVLFIFLYCIFVIPKISSFNDLYDGGHETGYSIIENAIIIFKGQKIMWLMLLCTVIRAFQIIRDKDNFAYYDSLLLGAWGFCFVCFFLRLNFVSLVSGENFSNRV